MRRSIRGGGFLMATIVALSIGNHEAAAQTGKALDMRDLILTFEADRDLLTRRWSVPLSELKNERMRRFFDEKSAECARVDRASLAPDSAIDLLALENYVRKSRAELDRRIAKEAEIADFTRPLAPIVALLEARERMQSIDSPAAARTIEDVARAADLWRGKIESGEFDRFDVVRSSRAVAVLRSLRRAEVEWFEFGTGYDPSFTWWLKTPQKLFLESLDRLIETIDRRLVKARSEGDAGLIGDPIGEAALSEALAFEFIPYSPQELIAIAEKEFAWCDERMRKASAALGFDDWRKAQEFVKEKHVPPGEQPAMVKRLADEAVAFLDARDLVTIPELCREGWRMDMMSIERQRVNPYFTGGETISVSYPTDDMTNAEKLSSMRDNCEHFSRATVQHELIPGHHLQGYMQARNRPYRRIFETPFWVEGWALYWEMRLWDLGFPRGPEDEIGMLFWRKHRCARIIFSLGFHSGKMTAKEAVDYLVDRVGHTRRSAEAEVRRSVGADYSPLYQAAYMLGGLQIRALHREFVGRKKMTERAFHDAVLASNAIPIALIRAGLSGERPNRETIGAWRFYDKD